MKEFNFDNAGGLQSTATLEIETPHRFPPTMPSKVAKQLF